MALLAEAVRRGFALVVLVSVCAASTLWAGEPQCRLGAYGLAMAGDLGRLERRIATQDDLTLVAIGSSSTAGAGATAPERSYPAQLEMRLKRHWPDRRVRVINRGINGEEAADMIRRFGADLLSLTPDLVIWQVGTNYLMRNEGVGRYGETLRDGLDRLQHAGVNVILMDPQYAPRVLADADHQTIVDLIADIARQRGVALFPRFKLMQAWAADGVSWAQMLTLDQLHLNDWSYACVAETLAGEIIKLSKK